MYLLKGQFTVKGSDLPLIQGFTVSFKIFMGQLPCVRYHDGLERRGTLPHSSLRSRE